MFKDRIGMVLKSVNLSTETVDQETRRVIACTFELDPFTSKHADALGCKSLLFDATSSLPKNAIDSIVLDVIDHKEPFLLSWTQAPDQDAGRVSIPDVCLERKVRIKLKTDREPSAFSAILSCNFRYPTADEFLFIANGVKDQHFLLFTPMKATLFNKDAETAGAAPPRTRRKGTATGDAAPQTH